MYRITSLGENPNGGVFMHKSKLGICLAGAAAGITTGLFGGGGGMVLVPALTLLTDLEDSEIFPASISIILPICVVLLTASYNHNADSLETAIEYLPGSALGGIMAGFLGKKIPVTWLHRLLGILILWGGIKYLC